MIVMSLPAKAGSHLVARLPECFLAAILFCLGVQLARPGHSFAVSHVYDVLARMASERVWALAAMAIGSVRIIALLLNGFFPVIRRVTPGVRATTAFLGGCMWAALTIGFIAENNLIVGIIAHAGLMTFDFTYALLVAGEAASYEKRVRNGCARK